MLRFLAEVVNVIAGESRRKGKEALHKGESAG